MTKTDALVLLLESENELRLTRQALAADDLPEAKKHFTVALELLDETCAIQLDDLN